jgi:hypothetical protein
MLSVVMLNVVMLSVVARFCPVFERFLQCSLASYDGFIET